MILSHKIIYVSFNRKTRDYLEAKKPYNFDRNRKRKSEKEQPKTTGKKPAKIFTDHTHMAFGLLTSWFSLNWTLAFYKNLNCISFVILNFVIEPAIATSIEDINKVVEDMDLSNDDIVTSNDAEHLEQKQPSFPTKMVHSRSEGDLSLEEERAKAYNSKNQENNNNVGLTSSESFNNFLYWRDPVPILEDIPKEDIEKKDEENDVNDDEAEKITPKDETIVAENKDEITEEKKGKHFGFYFSKCCACENDDYVIEIIFN